MDRRYTYVQDPGHGWVIVTPADLTELGLTRADFSQCSYVNGTGDKFALEEDCDAGIFLERCKARGLTFSLDSVQTDRDSVVRRWRPIR